MNRETIAKILGEAEHETNLTSVDQLNPIQKSRLKLAKAEGFVFGEVMDDTGSGVIVIKAKLQSFDSTIYWNESVTMTRGHLNDYTDRKETMEQLIRSISNSLESKPPDLQTAPDPMTNGSIKLFTGHSGQDKLRLCEEFTPNPFLIGDCAVLTWNGTQYNAVWGGLLPLSQRDLPEQPGAMKILGTIKIEHDGERGVILRRADITGITCIYHGALNEALVTSGTFACNLQGESISVGAWRLIPKP